MKQLKSMLTVFSICIGMNLFGQTNRIDTAVYNAQIGIENTFLWLMSNGQTRSYVYCGACTERERFGTFRLSGDTIFRNDTIQNLYEMHEGGKEKVTNYGSWKDTLYLDFVDQTRYLTYQPDRFKEAAERYMQTGNGYLLLSFFKEVAKKK
ncbi:MAG: hypothetical protein K1X82_03460 [Bacteroidia bacterium]|nr:hypothetical protein [Bacteroidia bacterium]